MLPNCLISITEGLIYAIPNRILEYQVKVKMPIFLRIRLLYFQNEIEVMERAVFLFENCSSLTSVIGPFSEWHSLSWL